MEIFVAVVTAFTRKDGNHRRETLLARNHMQCISVRHDIEEKQSELPSSAQIKGESRI